MAEPGRTLVLTAALTGLSRSELQGLKWDNFVGDKVNVGRAMWNGIVSDTKTLARKSSVPLLPVVVAALDAHKSRDGYNEWVFHGETRQPLRLDNYAKRVIGPTLKKIGLKWHGWHSLRRGLVTNLHKLGCPAKTAQAILRHAHVKRLWTSTRRLALRHHKEKWQNLEWHSRSRRRKRNARRPDTIIECARSSDG